MWAGGSKVQEFVFSLLVSFGAPSRVPFIYSWGVFELGLGLCFLLRRPLRLLGFRCWLAAFSVLELVPVSCGVACRCCGCCLGCCWRRCCWRCCCCRELLAPPLLAFAGGFFPAAGSFGVASLGLTLLLVSAVGGSGSAFRLAAASAAFLAFLAALLAAKSISFLAQCRDAFSKAGLVVGSVAAPFATPLLIVAIWVVDCFFSTTAIVSCSDFLSRHCWYRMV